MTAAIAFPSDKTNRVLAFNNPTSNPVISFPAGADRVVGYESWPVASTLSHEFKDHVGQRKVNLAGLENHHTFRGFTVTRCGGS